MGNENLESRRPVGRAAILVVSQDCYLVTSWTEHQEWRENHLESKIYRIW